MTPEVLVERFGYLSRQALCRPGAGRTPERHAAIMAAGREDLSLAKLIEAHWDAVAILQEAGREPASGQKYAVWASEIPGRPLELSHGGLRGIKEFCSGAALVDRALLTAGPVLVEIDLQASRSISLDETVWQTEAFRMTRTASVTFDGFPIIAVIGNTDWYTERSGFWQGACGPAAAWSGGAAGLLAYAQTSSRDDPHTLAHVAAMHADVWAMEALLQVAGAEFDREPKRDARVRALAVRHLVETMCTDVLRRFARAFGPAPLVKRADVARRYGELDLFLRQSHAERDLEELGRSVRGM